MTRLIFVSTAIVVLALIVGVSHAATEGYSEHLGTWERLFGDGKKITKLYSGKKQSEAGLAQVLVLPGLSITAVDGAKVKPKTGYWLFGHSAYNQLPGTYEFRVTSWKRRQSGWPGKHELGMSPTKPLEKHATYELKVVLEAGQKYIMSPIWIDGEMGIISPSQVCLQGHSDNARYCALRPRDRDEVFAMDDKYGVIVVGHTGFNAGKVILVNLGCDFYNFGPHLPPKANSTKSATKLSDVCVLGFKPTDSEGYIIESVDAGVWKWWGIMGGGGVSRLIETITFEVEPGKVNYVGHYRETYKSGKLMGLEVADHFSSLESTIRAGFGDSEIVNQVTDYPGSENAETEKKSTDY